MCGIMGMILNKQDRSHEDLEVLRNRFSNLLVATQVRGTDAAGAFTLSSDGIRYYKEQGAASSLVETPRYWGLMDTIGAGTMAAIGHTRFATTGCPTCNDNNHPILVDSIIGVHNGVLFNDDELREQYPYEQEVDSAAIFSALSGESDGVLTADTIVDTLPMLEGNFAIVTADARDTNSLFIARDDSRSTLYFLEDEDALWMASTREILTQGLGVLGKSMQPVKDNTVTTFTGGRSKKEVASW